ncbi:ABC transporter ATP-binding protein [Rhodanobacter sp. 115]|nr:ABC transporter ATP-binding protein [Rhodanobacter sp. 115]
MLAIRDLSKTYANGVKALRSVTLDIPNGMFGLLGPNGAGKSSLMRTIATLQDPDAGTIALDGVDLLADKQATRRLLGYLPQEFGVYPKVSAEAMLNHFAVLKGVTAKDERRELIEVLLRQVNLWDVRKRKLGTYSGGMRQRFGIAQALIGDPKLVIVDEPTAGLDPEERNRFLNLLAEIGERVVVILSTHIVEDVTNLCSHMAIIGQGQVAAGRRAARSDPLAGWPGLAPQHRQGRAGQLSRPHEHPVHPAVRRTHPAARIGRQPPRGRFRAGRPRSGRRLLRPPACAGHRPGRLTPLALSWERTLCASFPSA